MQSHRTTESTGVTSAPKLSPQVIGLGCVALTALGWGLNWPTTKYLLVACPPLSARGVAGLVGGGILFGAAKYCGETLMVPRYLWVRLATASLLNVSAWMGLTTVSLLWLPAGQAATTAYTMPVWVALLAWPLLGERPTRRQIGAIALGICGVLILVGGENRGLEMKRLPGIALALFAAISFSLGTILSKRMPIPLPPIALTAWQVALGCLPLLLSGMLFENADFARLPWIGWLALAYMALFSMGICYLLWFAAVRRLGTSGASIGSLLTPVVGVAASSVALGDSLTLSQAVSLGLVVCGILLTIRRSPTLPVKAAQQPGYIEIPSVPSQPVEEAQLRSPSMSSLARR